MAEGVFVMKQGLLFGSLVLGVTLFIGCGKTQPPPPVATEAEVEQQQMDMQKSMEAGKAAAGSAGK